MSRRMSAAARAERIMSIVPWLVTPGGVSISDTSRRFQIPADELLEDLDLLFYNVGVHPFTPDVRVEVFADPEDDHVEVRLGDFFRRPIRLGSDEALAIVAAARVVLATSPADESLLAAVEKVEAVLGAEQPAVGVEIEAIDEGVFAAVRSGLDRGAVLRIRYHSFGRDDVADREVEPLQLRLRDGRWYLVAWCRTAGEHRVFRLDRILEVHVVEGAEVGDHGEPPADPFDLSGASRRVRMLLAPEDEWVASQYPIESEETAADGRREVVLAAEPSAWLQRLLLRMGPGTEVRDADSGATLDDERCAAVRSILRRHR